jgi:hypothetical protein
MFYDYEKQLIVKERRRKNTILQNNYLGYLTKTDENVYKIDFVHFRIRDMKTNKILFEVERGSGKIISYVLLVFPIQLNR